MLLAAEPAGLEAVDEDEVADDAALDGRVEDVEELVVGDVFDSTGLDDPDVPDAVEDGDLSLTFSGFRSIVTGRFDPDDPELEAELPDFADEPDPLPSDDGVPPGVLLSLAIYLSPAPSQSQDLNYTRLFAKR
ncbi:hypothetical protein J7481_18075 [Labrenzia sp. R4_2]|uniref:hypothetical protein n=1 Tax=Labrenzia sp. R4_2 TaxID=2821107 RepID=UPI001ADC8464|nr:hypothetical protein [Labrenzia sp. R4_2]MBO9421420.1 hypothetical protein [Labrenzia sp. R4_2]